jgi:methyl-accepting chemotaxis protein
MLGFGLVLVLMGVLAVNAWRNLGKVQQVGEISTLVANLDGTLHLGRALTLTGLEDSDFARTGLPAEISALEGSHDELRVQLEQILQEFPSLKTQLVEIKRGTQEWRQIRREGVLPALVAGRAEEARQLLFGPQMQIYQQLREAYQRLDDQAKEQAQQLSENARDGLIILTVAAVAVAAMAAAWITRITAQPLVALTQVANRLAEGDTQDRTELDIRPRRDEIGKLLNAFKGVQDGMRRMAEVAQRIAEGDLSKEVKPLSERDQLGKAFVSMVDELRRSTRALSDGVNQLSEVGADMLASASQVAAGASETSSAIVETTSTVEEVKRTAELASQRARRVAQDSQQATAVAHGGRAAVEASVEGMRQIQAQMLHISDSVSRLSQHGLAIGEITTLVNGLADQSNLLAVNAAIEAAKAGEQGKGFAVVAQEVRSLAEQSRQATAQVRGLLQEMHKATQAAVLASEQGGKAVERGMQQSAEAGEVIARLTQTIAEAADAAAQIAQSSEQQLVGSDQVALAMQNIREASTQNVAVARRAEEAARQLDELGRDIETMIKRYRI